MILSAVATKYTGMTHRLTDRQTDRQTELSAYTREGKGSLVWFIPVADERVGVQVKL